MGLRIALGLILFAGAARAEEVRGTFKLDVIELSQGKDVAGKEELAVQHWKYRYLFANEQNKRKFEADPERYAVQMAGGCGRMGSLSGPGHPELHAVYDGKLYIFASDACRTAFLAAPETMLEIDDPKPPSDPGAVKRGRELLDKALAFVGGAAAVDAVKTYEKSRSGVQQEGGKMMKTGKVETVVFPDRLRREQYWDDWRVVDVTEGDDGFETTSRGAETLHPVQCRAHQRTFAHDLLVVLRSRNRPDFQVAVTGAAKIDDQPAELVTAWFDGSATTLAIDAQTGKVLRLSFRERGPRLAFGTVDQKIMEYREVSGVKVPVKWQSSFNGERVDSMDATLDSVKINEPVSEAAFERPG